MDAALSSNRGRAMMSDVFRYARKDAEHVGASRHACLQRESSDVIRVGSRWSRRQLLQVGGLGMLGPSLPALLCSRSFAAPGRMASRTEKSCIMIVQYGGASHIDSWDPKPGAPEEIRGPYQPIATNVPGFRVCELLPRLARMADRCCLLRSLTHQTVDHGEAMHFAMTGHSRPDK